MPLRQGCDLIDLELEEFLLRSLDSLVWVRIGRKHFGNLHRIAPPSGQEMSLEMALYLPHRIGAWASSPVADPPFLAGDHVDR